MSLITLVRHGETTWNAEGRVQGQLDAPLSARGVRQAEALAARMAPERFDALFASDLSRAHDTARRIAAQSGATIRLDSRLRERHYGRFEGLTWVEIKLKYRDEYERYRGPAFQGSVIPGGELLEDFKARVMEVMQEIAADRAHALVVAHGGLVDLMYREAMHLDRETPRDYALPNASVNRFRYDGAWKVEVFGDVGHLDAGSLDDS
jgi:probable phosphoglycerate mutase